MLIASRRTLLAVAGAAAAFPAALAIRPASAQTPVESRIGFDTYVTLTLQLGTIAMKTSELALERAENPEVREFAQLEIDEQRAVASALAASEAAGADLPPVNPDQQSRVDRLVETAAGPDFDLAYVETQIEAHGELLALQQNISGEEPATSIEVLTARLSEPAIRSHISMLGYIQQIMGHERIENVEEDAG